MNSLSINFDTKDTIVKDIAKLANRLLKEVTFRVNDATYLFLELEFYTYSENFQDPFTNKHPLLLEQGKLYAHASGIDLTFGNQNSEATNYGGILLRSILKIEDKALIQITGPQNVATEIISNLNLNGSNHIDLIESANRLLATPKIIKTRRHGLVAKPTDEKDYFLTAPLKFLAVYAPSSGFKQSIKGIEQLAMDLSDKESLEILGYRKKR